MKTRLTGYLLSTALLSLVAFCLATTLEPWHQAWEGGRTRADNVIQVALGDSRQLFARHFFLKADAYFHNGYYPTIYDRKEGYGQAHIAEQSATAERELDFLGPPRDWLDAFSRSFFPSRHTHLGEADCDHDHDDHDDCHGHNSEATGAAGHHHEPAESAGGAHEHAGEPCNHADHAHDHDHEHGPQCEGHKHDHDHDHEHVRGTGRSDEREILPWLKLALELDPQRVQTYVVAAFWLRTSLKQADQAERVLRDGLRQIPGDPELLLELGRVLYDERKDAHRARNLWELALKNWNEREFNRESPNFFVAAQILGNLATLEEKAGHNAVAIQHLERLSGISPNKDGIARWIATLRASAQAPSEAVAR